MSRKPRYPSDPETIESCASCARSVIPILQQNPVGLAREMNFYSGRPRGSHIGKTKRTGNVIVEMGKDFHLTAHPSGRTNAIHVKGRGEEVGLIPVRNSRTGTIKHYRRYNVGEYPASNYAWDGANVARRAIGSVVAAATGGGSAARPKPTTRKLRRKRSKFF